MPPLATTGSLSSLLASLHLAARRVLSLAILEGKQASLRLVSMLGLALLAAGLAITGWLGLLACIVVTLVQNNIASWGSALGIAALLSFAGAGGLALMLMRQGSRPLFAATQRQLEPDRDLESAVNDDRPPLAPHEQEVREGRMAAQAEYQVLRKRLRRRLGSPLIIGAGMLAGIAAGYLVRGRHRHKAPLGAGRPSAWMQVLGSLQVLTPLWIALHSASRPPASAAPDSAPHADGGAKAMGGEHRGP